LIGNRLLTIASLLPALSTKKPPARITIFCFLSCLVVSPKRAEPAYTDIMLLAAKN